MALPLMSAVLVGVAIGFGIGAIVAIVWGATTSTTPSLPTPEVLAQTDIDIANRVIVGVVAPTPPTPGECGEVVRLMNSASNQMSPPSADIARQIQVLQTWLSINC